MTKTAIERELRGRYLVMLNELLSNANEELLEVSANEYAIPCLDAEGNETCVIIKVSVPRGTRNGDGSYTPYDCYAVAEQYADECKEKEEKKKVADEKKAAKIASDAKKRAEKAAKKGE